MSDLTVTDIKLRQSKRTLEVRFADGQEYFLSCEYLRVFSPAADVQGHTPAQATLVTGKRNVNIIGIDPVGGYAVKLVFDDGYQNGIYSWETLARLGRDYETNWQRYLQQLQEASASRDEESK